MRLNCCYALQRLLELFLVVVATADLAAVVVVALVVVVVAGINKSVDKLETK